MRFSTSPMPPLLIYGATGYTGRLIAAAAVARGLRPVLCGRQRGRLEAAAERLGGLEVRVAALESPAALDAAFASVDVVLNAVGPFSLSAPPLADACLRAGAHYLDVTGEASVFEALAQRDEEARSRRVMLLPGVGFDVVPSDSLARHVADRAKDATWLAIGVRGLVFVSRGSYRTLVEQAGLPVRVRREGRLVEAPAGSIARTFDYGDGPRASVAVSWGDVVTAWHTTGIPNIDVYFEATPPIQAAVAASRLFGRVLQSKTLQVLLKSQAELLPEGPTKEQRDSHACVIVAEAGDEQQVLARARLATPEAYAFTGTAAAAVAEQVLAGCVEPGFATPARVLGPDYVTGLPGVTREDLPAG